MSPAERDAIAAVDAYSAAGLRLGTHPAGFTAKEMTAVMSKVAGPAVVRANVSSFMDLRKRGLRYDGTVVPTMTVAHPEKATSSGIEIYVTRCNDQRGFRALDKNGQVVDEATLGYPIPAFNLRQYTVRKPTGESHRRLSQGCWRLGEAPRVHVRTVCGSGEAPPNARHDHYSGARM